MNQLKIINILKNHKFILSHIFRKTVASTGIDFLTFTPTRNSDDVSPKFQRVYTLCTQ